MSQYRISDNRTDEIAIADAAFPAPFASGLEFNAPVHGTWNIVHIGMQLPESIQIYVCAKNCMRGVVLTAAEMNASDRFSYVILSEKDMVAGDIEDITIEGVADVIKKRKERPRAVLLFTVCVHHFLGCDYSRIYRTLEARFPDIDFFRCYMDPIMQKKGLTPDQKLRRAMMEKLPLLPADPQKITLLGIDFPLEEQCDLISLASACGCFVGQLPACRTYDDYLKLAEGCAFICIYPPGKVGAEQAAKRMNRPFFYFPASFDYDLIETQLAELFAFLCGNAQIASEMTDRLRKGAKDALFHARETIGDTPIVIDYTAHPRALGLAHLLISHGFCVDKVYIDVINGEEEADFLWLKEHAPQLILSATTHVRKRVAPRGRYAITAKGIAADPGISSGAAAKGDPADGPALLAIGQKAAWFEQTDHFVNLVSGGNLWGYSGIRRMAELMVEAYETKKDTRDIVPRKGWGCDSCI